MTDLYHIDKTRVKLSFNRAAETYDAAAVLQKEVRERMFSRLSLIKISPTTILDAGSGTGQAGRLLQKQYPQSQLVELDIAWRMLAKSREEHRSAIRNTINRLFGIVNGNAVCADIEHLPLTNASVGFVWSSLAIQWCNDLDQAFTEFNRILQPGGLFMFSTFGPDTLKELRDASTADPGHVHVNRFIDMHDIGDALIRAGFTAPVLDVEHFTLTYDDVVGVMRDLKAIGAHNATAGRRRGLEGKGFLASLAERYERYRNEGKLPATFEVVYGHAWKPETSKSLEEGVAPITLHRKKPKNV
ncbi:MAG TPA: malonyl-ACP O-methyltransferase BioC [Methylophilaceae bacterium]|nr:malonyl-ACP O-methyltransferase BioC [Methylophilaceae bacterium]